MNKKILVAGNANYGLAKELYNLYPDATFMSRSTGYDLTSAEGQAKASALMLDCDIFINCSALWKFNQTVLLDKLYKFAVENNKCPYIICIGSTTDRVKKGGSWLYNAEKKALRDYCNTLGIGGVWADKPKITYASFGTMSNNQTKHPDRKCLDIDVASGYIKWLIEQPRHIAINEISIDPMQDNQWYNSL
jgi:NADP-dependent 3-hydroxy acid dehydrogenase YdfG